MVNFSDPIVSYWYTDPETGSKISISVTNEQNIIVKGIIVMSAIPDQFYHVSISGMTEIKLTQEITLNTQYKIDYQMGLIYFHISKEGEQITYSFYSRGKLFFPANRIYTSLDLNGDVSTVLQDQIDSIATYDHKGIYDNETTYAQNNIVYYNGSTYICTTITTMANYPTDTTKWRMMSAGHNNMGNYNLSTQYYPRDEVWYDTDKSYYICILKPTIGTIPSNVIYWSKLLDFESIYDAETSRGDSESTRVSSELSRVSAEITRSSNEITRQNNESTRVSNENTRISNESTRQSQEISRQTTITNLITKGDYNGSTQYYKNNMVKYTDGCGYGCILDSLGNLPTNTTYWKKIVEKGSDGAGGDVYLNGTQTLTNKTISGTNNTLTDISADSIVDGETNKVYSATEKTKLSAVKSGATNSTTSTTVERDVNGSITGKQIISDVAQGVAPLSVISTTKVTNLNADKLDDLDSTAFATATQGTKADNALPISGGTMTGTLVAQSNTSYTTAQVHNVILSTSDAVVGSMNNGDIWIKYV